MNNEIKEIFNNFKEHLEKNYQSYLGGAVDSTEYYMSCGDLKLLLDYITNLQEENDKFDETMKDIKDNLIARINRQECEIHNLKAKLEMYENGVYFSSENDKLQERIDKAIEYIKNNKLCICKEDEGIMFTAFVDKELLEILKGDSSNENN